MSYEQRAERLNQLFLEKIVPFVRDVSERAMNSGSDGQLFYSQALEYQNRAMKADIIKAKFENITREYNGQNKQFQDKHEEICQAESQKRLDIEKNFDEHIAGIKSSMEVDVQKSREENKELADDTKQLTEKYEELKKETAEKIEIMTKQLED